MIARFPTLARGAILFITPFAFSTPALAQEQATQPGSNAEVAGTEIGERQTREDGAANVEPIRRISNRIQNRVQNRIRNRIDRNYDPQANATSPFEVAAERADAARRRSQGR